MTGKELLTQGQQLRESGKTLEALDAINRSLQAFALEGNNADFAHALIDRAICWQHLYQFHNYDFGFAVLYKKDAEAAIEIVQEKNISREEAGAIFINAKAAVIFGEFGKAVDLFRAAIEKMTPDHKAQKGDWQTNLGKALYLNGDKEAGLKETLEGITQIKKFSGEVDDYRAKVWLSGGYMRLSEILINDDPQKSKQYLSLAQSTLGSDPKFGVRLKQIETYVKTGKTGL